jgi:hypothetical protein
VTGEPLFFGPGVAVLLDALRPYGQAGRVTFPLAIKDWKGESAKLLRTRAVAKDEPPSNYLASWFGALTKVLGGPKSCSITDKVAIFADLSWDDETRIRTLHVQALVTPHSSLAELVAGESVLVHYLRLDQEPSDLGSIFKNAFPHIHLATKGEPYFRPAALDSGNAVVDFVEFIFKMYEYDLWIKWLDSVYHEIYPRKSRDDFFGVISRAFKTNQFDSLCSGPYALHLKALRTGARKQKDDAFPLRVDVATCDALSYGW